MMFQSMYRETGVFRSFARALVLGGGLAIGVMAQAVGQEITWPEYYYNPKPNDDGQDLILPLPCGGAMAFRPVTMAAGDLAADLGITIGDVQTPYGYMEGKRTAHFMAPFQDPDDPNRRILYMATYELTADQYAALTGECPAKPNMKGRLPALGLSWFDAIQAAHAYTQWLLAEAPDKLPKNGAVPGFVRLPSEVEWEYAVRGGAKVSRLEFLGSVFPTPGGLGAYAWSVEANSSNGKPKPVGLKRPNPVGLHDMLGNADEIVLEPFQLTHVGRLHGLIGGYVVRGGNYLMSAKSLRGSFRTEIPYYRKGEAGRTSTNGTRFVISSEVVNSREKLRDIQIAWDKIAATDTPAPTPPPPPPPTPSSKLNLPTVEDDPIKELQALSVAVEEQELQIRLTRVAQEFRLAIDDRNRARDKSARSLLRQGGIVLQELGDDAGIIKLANELIASAEKTGMSSSVLSKAYSKQKQRLETFDANLRGYANLVVEVAEAFPDAVIVAQRDILSTLLREDGSEKLLIVVDRFSSHVHMFRSIGTFDIDGLKKDFGL